MTDGWGRARKYLEYAVRFSNDAWRKINLNWQRGANRRTLIALSVAGIISLYVYLTIISPPAEFPIGDLVTVESGQSLADITNYLAASHVVRSEAALRYLIQLEGRDAMVRAGDYLFNEPKDLFSVARAITTGQYGLEPARIRIPEGATSREIAKIFSTRLKRVSESHFAEIARQHEGYLFPDTYFFLPNASEQMILETLRQNFDSHIQALAGDIASFGKPLPDIVIMASLLEKEARTQEDRRMIAGVLWRRIKMGMPLQVDAAFLYTLGKSTFQLTVSDLKTDSPYNTYTRRGLPPGPIDNPSLDAIKAAVTPIDKGYVYYLADKHGHTYYSKTYDEHVRKKYMYIGT